MSTARPLVSYEPNPLLAWLYHRFFEHIEVDESWISAVREADARGTVVYALRNLSFVDFFALDYLTKRYMLPQVRFANDMGLWVLEPMGRGWLRAFESRTEEDDANDLKRAVLEGSSAALFMKRPPNPLAPGSRGKRQADAYLRALFEAQRASDKPILVVPQVFVWSKQHDTARHTVVDWALGPREWPGKVRTVAQFLANFRDPTLRAGEPVDVKQFLASDAASSESGAIDDDVRVRRMTYTLLRRLERERRAVIGPTMKPADRLREEVIRSPKLKKIIADMAGDGDAERLVITARAHGMLREVEASLDHAALTAIAPAFEQAISRMYQEIEVDEPGLALVREAARKGTLVLLPSHKSHVDYMVLSHTFLKHHLQLPLIAAGDNLNFFPIGPIFRRAGAFFIRRSFGTDRLYSAVVDAYVRRLIKDGWTLEFFLEGGRSRTGKLLPPKLGLLSLVVDAALGASGRQVHFCPVSIGYERFVEEKAFVHELTGGEKSKEDVRGLVKSVNMMAQRYGRLNVQFAPPLTLDGVLAEIDPTATREALVKMTPAKRRALVTRLAHRVMHEINRVTAVTPGALVATALLTHGRRGVTDDDLIRTCQRITDILRRFGARFTPSLLEPGSHAIKIEAIREACELFVRAGNVVVRSPSDANRSPSKKIQPGRDAIYVVPDEARLSLDLSKNIVVHFFVSRALVATALLAPPGSVDRDRAARDGGDPDRGARNVGDVEALRERVRALSRLFKYEFVFRADAPFEQIFDDTLAEMEADGEIARAGSNVTLGEGEGRKRVVFYASEVRNFVEGYRVAARGLAALLKGPLPAKDLVKRAIGAGDRMFLAGEIERREAVCRPILENAYNAFVDQGYVTRADGKLAIAESYASIAELRTIEARIAGWLPRRSDDASG